MPLFALGSQRPQAASVTPMSTPAGTPMTAAGTPVASVGAPLAAPGGPLTAAGAPLAVGRATLAAPAAAASSGSVCMMPFASPLSVAGAPAGAAATAAPLQMSAVVPPPHPSALTAGALAPLQTPAASLSTSVSSLSLSPMVSAEGVALKASLGGGPLGPPSAAPHAPPAVQLQHSGSLQLGSLPSGSGASLSAQGASQVLPPLAASAATPVPAAAALSAGATPLGGRPPRMQSLSSLQQLASPSRLPLCPLNVGTMTTPGGAPLGAPPCARPLAALGGAGGGTPQQNAFLELLSLGADPAARRRGGNERLGGSLERRCFGRLWQHSCSHKHKPTRRLSRFSCHPCPV
ncbi:hypothetical protein cyc_06883 [Cyclospora cayetanensis]|uniref:Uncharacterized protein n=1 Tax=Cyclospora cayetanensis TaxID=88456 RepID=A0A1D3D2F1_9EIME|nr:hypothetical protein cyc_06883 [Cyclospora cayetanensis]